MRAEHSEVRLVTGMDVQEYFRQEVGVAMQHQQVRASDETTVYVVNLLAAFARADRLFEQRQGGAGLRPLALMYADALEAPTLETRHAILRRLADVALFMSGVFADSLQRKVVDVDYYVAMGVGAYGYLSENVRGPLRRSALAAVFRELAAKFQEFVDVLGEVSERAHLTSESDVLRLYDLWVKTGSRRAAQKLRELGLQPSLAAVSRRQH